MGKRIIQQARGKGSLTYRVRRRAYLHKFQYPMLEGEAEIINLIHSAGHSAPVAKLKIGNEIFFMPAFNGAFIGQKINIGKGKPEVGNILPLNEIPAGTQIYNLELNPGDGGKMMKCAGTSASIVRVDGNKTVIKTAKRKEISLSNNCRATIGVVAGEGRKLKPFMKAGRKHYQMKARNKLWPRTSSIKMNVVDHPFGSGRGKRAKSKIAKRNSPPGRKVGHLSPRRTGRAK
jgi:large subunit ribosomal protein L2